MLQASWTTYSSANSPSPCSSFCISWNLPSPTLLACPKTPTHFSRFKPTVVSPKPQNHFLGMRLCLPPNITSSYPLWDGDDDYREDSEIISRETRKICISPYFLQSWKTKRGKWHAQGHVTIYQQSRSWKSKNAFSFSFLWDLLIPTWALFRTWPSPLLSSYRYPGFSQTQDRWILQGLLRWATLEGLLIPQESPGMSSTFRLIPNI